MKPSTPPRPLIALALAVAGWSALRADEPVVNAPVPQVPVPAVQLAETPPAATVVAEDPSMEIPAQEVVLGLARRDFQSGVLGDNINRDAVAARMDAGGRPETVEESRAAFRHLRRRPGWRGVADLFNPLAPLPTEPAPPAVLTVEGGSGPVDLRPRRNVLADGVWVEHGIRLW